MRRPFLQQTPTRRTATALVAMATVLFVSPAVAVQQKRASFKLPNFSETLLDISSAPVENFSPDTALPIEGAEQVNLHNLTLRSMGTLPAEMRDTHFVISLANNSHNLSVERCQRFAKMQTSCSPVSDVNPKQHPQFAEGHLYNVGNIEIGILSSKSICKDSDRCAIKIPSFVLRALSQGKTPTLPSLVSVVRLEKSLELLDGERGFQIMKLTSFPAGLAPGRLGKVVRIEAEHRGNLKIEFEQAHLRLNLLEERGVLAASDGDVWSLIEGSHTTRWTQANKTNSLENKQVCKGPPLATSELFAVYRNCVVPFGRGADQAMDALSKLQLEIDGAESEQANKSSFKAWSAANGRLTLMNLQISGGEARLKTVLEKQFYGRTSAEAAVFSNRIFRHTADGIYLVGDDVELKTSLPASPHPVFFGEDGMSLLLGFEDGARKCALKHMESSPEKPTQWRETGFNFPCLKSRVSTSTKALTVTKIESGIVEIFVLSGN